MSDDIKYANSNSYPKISSKPGRVDLVPREIDKLIDHQGVKIRVTPTMICPNRTEIEGTNHSLDCSVCNGDEVLDLSGQCWEDWALVQSIKLDKKFDPQGIWDIKDSMITFKSHNRVYYWYKVEILDFSSIYNQLIKRSGTTDKIRYPIASSCDTPIYMVDKTGKQYTHLEDFRIDGQELKFLGTNKPAQGTLYSLTYPILPTFRILETTHDNRYYFVTSKQKERKPVNLPQQAVMRWDYLANRQGSRELVGTV